MDEDEILTVAENQYRHLQSLTEKNIKLKSRIGKWFRAILVESDPQLNVTIRNVRSLANNVLVREGNMYLRPDEYLIIDLDDTDKHAIRDDFEDAVELKTSTDIAGEEFSYMLVTTKATVHREDSPRPSTSHETNYGTLGSLPRNRKRRHDGTFA
ncbi:hypothetical protein JTB14_001535 [Gonioctena quinquepunctata]|nr:hypothetical protein JTB14_001535 [Gonioctena quinquepunctata]